ncbi:MAG: hypothetical protein US54_C0001G0060 [Candidatus Roizmanbacteria bacterium GW2011_GWA2_37_7]|uniref:Uncharacterized protein n=1 Tax=Candidatus Roizmanbacteria bacterium GW2011_GWA2_37_7 TaxID=1618481 RepID=A0A0G0HK44_9BACT|nr:MAG: hypothetical protein US54_C0001G0060 [Candidatus Roizmanbacteria bacterium GW2011_GWA2_37_7]
MVDISSSKLPQKDIPPANKEKVIGLIVLSILIFSIVTGSLFITYLKYTSKGVNNKSIQNVNIEDTKESSNFSYLGISEEIESVLQQIFTGKINYDIIIWV